MKTFMTILEETKKTFDFKVWVANCQLENTMLDKIELALKAYDLANISKPKSIPTSEQPMLFPTLGACEMQHFEVSVNYPCVADHIRQLIYKAAGIQESQVVVFPKGMNLIDYASTLNTKPSEEVSVKNKDKYGKENIDSFLKGLEPRKYEVAGGKTPLAKTTNDIPQGNRSPISGSKGK